MKKFRVYDKKHQIMLEPIELSKLLKYLLFQKMPNSTAYDMMKDHFDDLVWLRFTNLPDKNKVDIYEGDILLINIGYANEIKAVVKNGVVRIEDNEGYMDNLISGFYLDPIGINNPVHLDDANKGLIIGNIYQNPELLK